MLVVCFPDINDDAIDDLNPHHVLLSLIIKSGQSNLDLVFQVSLLLLVAPLNQSLAHFDLQVFRIRDFSNLVNHLPDDLRCSRLREHIKAINLVDDQLLDPLRNTSNRSIEDNVLAPAIESCQLLIHLFFYSQFILVDSFLILKIGHVGK